MRPGLSLVTVAALVAATAPVRAEPLGTAELRVGYGLASGGGAGRAAVRATPLTLAVGGSLAIADQPRTAGYASLVIETLDRTGVGGEGGLMLTPSPRFRMRAGVIAIARPYTLWGATVGASVCAPMGGVRLCGDAAADLFVGGTDLPAKTAVVQVVGGLGVVIDVD